MDEKVNLLIIEDEEKIRKMLGLFLEREGFRLLEAEDGESGLAILADQKVDLVLLDLMMPGLDGWTTCKKIREKSAVPILILTARGEEADRVLGFELGADDYVVKPFSPRELVLRVKAMLRRKCPGSFNDPSNDGGKHFPDLDFYPEGHKVLVKGQGVNLSPLEYNLLAFLIENPGRVFTRDHLLDRVWGYDFAGDSRTVDTHIRRLREKLSQVSERVAGYVVTVRGAGYKFEVTP